MSLESRVIVKKSFRVAKQILKAVPAVLVVLASAFTGGVAADPVSMPGHLSDASLPTSPTTTMSTHNSVAAPVGEVDPMPREPSRRPTEPAVNPSEETEITEGPSMKGGGFKSGGFKSGGYKGSGFKSSPKPKTTTKTTPKAPTTKPSTKGTGKNSVKPTSTGTSSNSDGGGYTGPRFRPSTTSSSAWSHSYYDTHTNQNLYWTYWMMHSHHHHAPDNNVTVVQGEQNVSLDLSRLTNETGILIPVGNDPERWLTAVQETSVARPGVGNVSYLRCEEAEKFNLTGNFARCGVVYEYKEGKVNRMLLDVSGLDTNSPKTAFEVAFQDGRPACSGRVRTDFCKTGEITPIEFVQSANMVVNDVSKVETNAMCIEIKDVPTEGSARAYVKMVRGPDGSVEGARVKVIKTQQPTLG